MSTTSDCCDAPIWSGGMCSFCKEHCEPIHNDEESELAPINEAIETLSPMKTKTPPAHTPGPWTQGEEITKPVNAVFRGVLIKQGYMTLAEVFTDIPEGQSNARLIARAPALRESLAECVKALECAHELLFRHPGTPEHGTAMTLINNAVSKARSLT